MNNNRNRISDWAAWLTIGGLVWIVVSILRDSVRFADLARHVFFTETGEPLPRERVTKSPLIGECRGLGIYLLYSGILGDKSAAGGNVLTRAVLARLPAFDGQKVIYCAGCLLGCDRSRRRTSWCVRSRMRSKVS